MENIGLIHHQIYILSLDQLTMRTMQNKAYQMATIFGAIACLLIGATSGILITRWTQTDISDYFSLFGSIFGSALAVMGAIITIYVQRHTERGEAHLHLAGVVSEVISACRVIGAPLPPPLDDRQTMERATLILGALADIEWCDEELKEQELNRRVGFVPALRYLRKSIHAVMPHVALVRAQTKIAVGGPAQLARAHDLLLEPIQKLGERARNALEALKN